MVAITTTSAQYTSVFSVPRMVLITSILGSDSAGPASSSASAGPLPMPAPISASTMGTSVRVEKYISAPSTEASTVEVRLLSPTAAATHSDGIMPSLPGRPSAKPATNTPASSNGSICLAKSQLCTDHSRSCSRNEEIIIKPAMPSAKGSSGASGTSSAATTTMAATTSS